MLSILIDSAKVGTQEYFAQEVERYTEFVKTSAASEDGGEVLVPGEIEARNRTQRLAEGLDMDETTWGQLVGAAEDTGVDPSVIEAATP